MNRTFVALGVFVFAAIGRGQTGTAFEGIWVGEVIAPNATAVIGFAFTRGPTGLIAKFAMPAMFVSGLNLGPAKIVGETYEMPELGIRLTHAGDALIGTFAGSFTSEMWPGIFTRCGRMMARKNGLGAAGYRFLAKRSRPMMPCIFSTNNAPWFASIGPTGT